MDSAAPSTVSVSSTNLTPSVTTITSTTEQDSSSTPWPGKRYIIEHVATSKVITLHRAEIHLRCPKAHASIRWDCVQYRGWVLFQDPASGLRLDHDFSKNVTCTGTEGGLQQLCSITKRPCGDYLLLMPFSTSVKNIHYCSLGPVGWDGEKLKIMGDVDDKNVGWRFIEVPIEDDD